MKILKIVVLVGAVVSLCVAAWFLLTARSYQGDGTFRDGSSYVFGLFGVGYSVGYSITFPEFSLNDEFHVVYHFANLPVAEYRDPAVIIGVDGTLPSSALSSASAEKEFEVEFEGYFTIEIRREGSGAVLSKWAGVLAENSYLGTKPALFISDHWRGGNTTCFQMSKGFTVERAAMYTMKLDYRPIKNADNLNGWIAIYLPRVGC